MISMLISGTLVTAPCSRVGRGSGNKFVTAQIKTFDGDESVLIGVVAFDPGVCTSLLALSKGDDVVIAGSGKPKTWTNREGEPVLGLDLKAQVLMTQYAVTKKRKAAIDIEDFAPAYRSQANAESDEGGLF